MSSSAIPTVEIIAQDTVTQISYKYWSPVDENQPLEPFNPNLIVDIYQNELVKSKFALRRIMLLEFTQYLEKYLWKYYQIGQANKAHVISIATMVNEKFRERVFAWDCFTAADDSQTEEVKFADLFHNVLRLCLDQFESCQSGNGVKKYEYASFQEYSILVKFLDNCVSSLEVDLVRNQVQRLCNLGVWHSLSDNRREHELSRFGRLRKYWKAIEKNDAKLGETERAKLLFERTFLSFLIRKFLKVLYSLNSAKSNSNNSSSNGDNVSANLENATPMEFSEEPSKETGELDNEDVQQDARFKLSFLNRCLELLIDLEALLPTRRFFNTLLDDAHLLVHCHLSELGKESVANQSQARMTQSSVSSNQTQNDRNLFGQLLGMLQFYTQFEIDDQTGEAKTEPEIEELHYDKLKRLQTGVFKYFREDLLTFSLTNIACIDKRDTLVKQLDALSQSRLYALAEYLHLVPHNAQQKFSKSLLLEIIIWHMASRPSQLSELNAQPLYPTERVIWDENLVPSEFRQSAFSDASLALPKLSLKFLTLHDYLWRNFQLFRLEAAYELRQDLEEACVRARPYYSFEEQMVCFDAWTRMALPVVSFGVAEVGKPRVGEAQPSHVRAQVTLDLDMCGGGESARAEWDSLRKHDIGYLVTLRPSITREQLNDKSGSFLTRTGLVYVRGCEIEGVLNEEGKLINDEMRGVGKAAATKFTSTQRTLRVLLDPNQYKIDTEQIKDDVYTTFNLFVRRRPKENNFKAILECIRDLMNTKFAVPDWLRDLILGYGEPQSAHYSRLSNPAPVATLDFNDTFLSRQHLLDSFPGKQLEFVEGSQDKEGPFRLTFTELLVQDHSAKPWIRVEAFTPPNRGPYACAPIGNRIRFTPTQIEAIKSGMEPGLTLVIGPPGTGKTDVAVQIIANIYRNFAGQKTLVVTHSNQALNQLFEKIMRLDIDERHLLRLGHGEDELDTLKDFSRYGRVNYALAKRLELLDEVDRLQKSLDAQRWPDAAACHTAAYSCETAVHFYLNFIRPMWQAYVARLDRAAPVDSVAEEFPFAGFFATAPRQPVFSRASFTGDWDAAQGCFRHLRRLFKQLEEFRALELIRNGADRAEYLVAREAKIVAMTCTHAALKRADLVRLNFRYDNILMEESAQILEIETFVPLLLQSADHNGQNRLKRWIMIGDHNQLPPVIKNVTFQKYCNMEQSLFARFVKLGVPTVDLDAQGRSRSSLCDLYRWRYKSLGDLSHVTEQTEFKRANAGFLYDYQLVNVADLNGVGESEPQPHMYQNLAEAEYVVAVFMHMRMIGHSAESITILSTYNGQKHLIREILRKRCASNPLIGLPKTVTTVDKYQGSQNDIVLLSLVRTRAVGHLRDVRRLIVAMSRARLGLYIFARVSLFKSCYELTPVFNLLLQRPTQLCLVTDELHPCQRATELPETGRVRAVADVTEMSKFVFDFYQERLQVWQRSRREQESRKQQAEREERRRKLDEEERVLRERMDETLEKARDRRTRLDIDLASAEEPSSSESDSEVVQEEGAEEEVGEGEAVVVSENTYNYNQELDDDDSSDSD